MGGLGDRNESYFLRYIFDRDSAGWFVLALNLPSCGYTAHQSCHDNVNLSLTCFILGSFTP